MSTDPNRRRVTFLRAIVAALKDSKREISRLYVVSMLVAVVATTLSFAVLVVGDAKFQTTVFGSPTRTSVISKIETAVDALERNQNSMIVQLDKFEAIIGKFQTLPTDAQSKALIAGFSEQIENLQSRFKNIEDIIAQDPSKALSLVLLKRDLDALSRSIEDKAANQNANIERLYSIFGWSLGALIIAIAAQILATFLSRRGRVSQ